MDPELGYPPLDPDFICKSWIETHCSPVQGPDFILVPKQPSLFSDSNQSDSLSQSSEKIFQPGLQYQPPATPSGLPPGCVSWSGDDRSGGASCSYVIPADTLDTATPATQTTDSTAGRFVARLHSSPAPHTTKRKAGTREPSPTKSSKASTTHSDTRRKRIALTLATPKGVLGIPDPTKHASAIPAHVIKVLQRFSPSLFDASCVPQTPEVDALLSSFDHEVLAPHTRFVPDPTDAPAALQLISFAISVHRAALYASLNSNDESAWYPIARRLLCIEPPTAPSAIPTSRNPDDPPEDEDFFLTIDATTKVTTSTLPPDANVKLDALLIFKHRFDAAIIANLRVNAFSDASLEGHVVALGVEVKALGAEMEAEYQIGVWGMKTLHLARELTGEGEEEKCAFVMGVSVCAHVWSMHVTYRRGDGVMVTHGPVVVGSTDSVYGTCKIIKWVCEFKEWAREVMWGEWKDVVEKAVVGL